MIGKQYKNYIIKTIFIGGGTPSILSTKQIKPILKAINKVFECFRIKRDIQLNVIQEHLIKTKVKTYKRQGVNRLSIGLQSSNNAELENLGRIHTYEEFLETYEMIRKQNIKNVNIDLISGLPYQKLKDWEKTLYAVMALSPEHISAYSLIIEEGTKFYDTLNQENLPDEYEDREMYYKTKEILGTTGYKRYEISNYSKKDKECIHNIGYWIGKEYVGIGLGASSYINNTRYSNTRDFSEYVKKSGDLESIKRDILILTKQEKMEEFMFLGLRLIDGVKISDFEKEFDVSYRDIFGYTTDKLIDRGLISRDGERIYLTDKGIDLSNVVFSEFIEMRQK